MQQKGLITAVTGAQWGDEGKGKVVDAMVPAFDVVVRYNGGANAGHSVQVGAERFALHQVPSGILAEKLCVIGNGVVVDPKALLEEIEGLRQRKVAIGQNLRLSDRAHVVLPYHREFERLVEGAFSQSRGGAIGTTGRGIGPAYAFKAMRTLGVRIGDLLDRRALWEKLVQVVNICNVTLPHLAAYVHDCYEPLDASRLLDEYTGYGEALQSYISDTVTLLHDLYAADERILFEGANGTLLGLDHGTFPTVTASDPSVLGVPSGAGFPGHFIQQVVVVVKAYITRVGNGPLPTEQDNEIGQRIRARGREFGTTTGRPRRCGWLDLVALRYAVRLNGADTIALTLLDVLSGFNELQVCVRYERGGRTVPFQPDARLLAEVTPVYETVPGWADDISDCRVIEELPPAARRYVELVEEAAGANVDMVGVGPEREQLAVWSNRGGGGVRAQLAADIAARAANPDAASE